MPAAIPRGFRPISRAHSMPAAANMPSDTTPQNQGPTKTSAKMIAANSTTAVMIRVRSMVGASGC